MLEDLFGPPDLEIDDGADDGRLGLRAVGGDMGLEFEGGLLAGRIGSGAHRRTRGDVDEGSEWVLREGRGNMSGGGAGDGGNDEGSVENRRKGGCKAPCKGEGLNTCLNNPNKRIAILLICVLF